MYDALVMFIKNLYTCTERIQKLLKTVLVDINESILICICNNAKRNVQFF